MWKPWVGKNYSSTRLLLLGESAYSWAENGETVHPGADHSHKLVNWAIDDFEGCRSGKSRVRFAVALSRGLTGELAPSPERLRQVWDRVAFTNYVGGTVGHGPRVPPSQEQWDAAAKAFLGLLAEHRPLRVVVLARRMWWKMPPTAVQSACKHVEAYSLPGDELSWCHAVKHPSGGLGWQELARVIREDCGIDFDR